MTDRAAAVHQKNEARQMAGSDWGLIAFGGMGDDQVRLFSLGTKSWWRLDHARMLRPTYTSSLALVEGHLAALRKQGNCDGRE